MGGYLPLQHLGQLLDMDRAKRPGKTLTNPGNGQRFGTLPQNGTNRIHKIGMAFKRNGIGVIAFLLMLQGMRNSNRSQRIHG